jgi:hypothetical protein
MDLYREDIMSVGFVVSKGEIDSRMGDLARSFQKLFRDEVIMKSYFDSTADADLVALGYEEGEVAILKSAIADLDHLRRIALGEEALAASKDFTAFLRLLWGVGAQ